MEYKDDVTEVDEEVPIVHIQNLLILSLVSVPMLVIVQAGNFRVGWYHAEHAYDCEEREQLDLNLVDVD